MAKSVERARAALLAAMRRRCPGAPRALTSGPLVIKPPAAAEKRVEYAAPRTANGRIYLTGETSPARTLPTRDPADKAHQARDSVTGRLLPGSWVPGSPRRYPRSAMTSQGVAFDSAFDQLHEMQRRLACIPGLGGRGGSSCSDACEKLTPTALRRLVRE